MNTSKLTEAQNKLRQLQKQKDNLASDICKAQETPSTTHDAEVLLGLQPPTENQQPQLEQLQHQVEVLDKALVMQKSIVAKHTAQAVREARKAMLPQRQHHAKQAHQHLTAFVETVLQDAAICLQAASQGVELYHVAYPLTLHHMVRFDPAEMLTLWTEKHKALLAG